MAISRRLRFEILRRDGHTCRYCGAKAPDVALTVDHVIPVALGGSDDPSNLVTACAECNAGKSSIPADAAVVADVAADALRWKAAMEQAQAGLHAERQVLDGILERFEAEWNDWTFEYEVKVPPAPVKPTGNVLIDNWLSLGYPHTYASRPVSFKNGVLTIQVRPGDRTEIRRDLKLKGTQKKLAAFLDGPVEFVEIAEGWDGPVPQPPGPTYRTERTTIELPAGWQQSIERFISNGLPESELIRNIRTTMESRFIRDRWRWFCGICWNRVTDLQEDARRIVESETQTEA